MEIEREGELGVVVGLARNAPRDPKGRGKNERKNEKKNKQKNTKRRERKEKIWEKKFECLCVWTYADNIQQHIHVTYKPVYTCIAAAAAAVEAAAVELTWRLS